MSYGCDLDHNNIDYLVKERLMPYSLFRAYWRNEKPPKETDICFINDIFDINRNKYKDNQYYLDKFYINEMRMEAFMYSLSKLKGNHIYAVQNVRGHAVVLINNVEYSARIYQSLYDEGMLLVFLDDEALANVELREKLTSLPSELQYLTLPNHLSLEESNSLVAEWIQSIIDEIEKKK